MYKNGIILYTLLYNLLFKFNSVTDTPSSQSPQTRLLVFDGAQFPIMRMGWSLLNFSLEYKHSGCFRLGLVVQTIVINMRVPTSLRNEDFLLNHSFRVLAELGQRARVTLTFLGPPGGSPGTAIPPLDEARQE